MSQSFQADVVIVGSGVAGAITGYRLARTGAKVLILEAGPRVDRAVALLRFQKSLDKSPNSPYPAMPHAPQPEERDLNAYYVQEGPDEFRGLQTRVVGGTTWHWGGTALRLHPNDFVLKSKYGVGVDWPIRYADLDAFYNEAESEIGVAGESSEDWGSPRRSPNPMPAVAPTYLDQQVKAACAPLGLTVAPFPQGRNTVVRDNRPPCCGNASCVPICPIHAKYDASGHVEKAEAVGAQIVPLAVAYKVVIGKDGRVTAIRFKRPDGSEGEARGKIFVIAAHAVETPKLLLMSTDERTPAGVANSSGQVGRNLLTQVDVGVIGLTRDPLYPYRGPVSTSGIKEFRDGDFRGRHAAVGTSPSNEGWQRAVGPLRLAERLAATGLRGPALARAVRDHSARELALGTSAEVLPDPSNRVTLALDRRDPLGLPRPKIRFKFDPYALAGLTLARERQDKIMAALGATDTTQQGPIADSAVMGGTARMGTDRRTAVVDRDLRAHDHRNLYIVGAAAFPTIGTAPPTLTIAALAVRAARRIAADLARPA
jgi:choline dehydrogenase-like flavoprotein